MSRKESKEDGERVTGTRLGGVDLERQVRELHQGLHHHQRQHSFDGESVDYAMREASIGKDQGTRRDESIPQRTSPSPVAVGRKQNCNRRMSKHHWSEAARMALALTTVSNGSSPAGHVMVL
jgi:hypothetical protein